jgi:HSP20 family molecular chaperone IbpA
MLSRVADAMNKTKICKDTKKWINNNVSNTTNHLKKNVNNVLNGKYWKESNNANINELNYSIVEDNKKLYKIYIELPGVLSESINMSFYMHDLIITAIKPTPSGIHIYNLPSESNVDEESSTGPSGSSPSGPSGSSPSGSSSDSSHKNCDKQDKKITGNMKYGSIHSIIQLPVIVTSHNNIQYVYVNGILKITIPIIAVQDPVVIKYKKRSKVV